MCGYSGRSVLGQERLTTRSTRRYIYSVSIKGVLTSHSMS